MSKSHKTSVPNSVWMTQDDVTMQWCHCCRCSFGKKRSFVNLIWFAVISHLADFSNSFWWFSCIIENFIGLFRSFKYLSDFESWQVLSGAKCFMIFKWWDFWCDFLISFWHFWAVWDQWYLNDPRKLKCGSQWWISWVSGHEKLP